MSSIFVAKLDFAVTDEELNGLFAEYGTVSKAHIAKDKETGKPRGFAFVEMSNDEETSAAIKGLDGRSINGREIVVKLAEDRSGGKPAPRSAAERTSSGSRSTYTPPAPKEESPFQNDSSSSSSSSDDSSKTPKRGKSSGPKKSGGGSGGGGGDRFESRENKMSAYKKSGKNTRVEFDEDDDWELEFKKSNKSGWDEDDEEED